MPPAESTSELSLRDYLQIVQRRKQIVIIVVLLAVVPAVVFSLLRTPVYEGDAELLLQPRTSETLFDPNTGVATDPARQVQNEIRILSSQPVRAAVRATIGVAPKVQASGIGATDLIQVAARSTDPNRAVLVANTYANSYIEYRRKQAVDDVLAASQQVQSKISDLQKQIDAAAAGAQRDSLVQTQAGFKTQLDQLQVAGALKQGGAQLVTPATVPSSPVEPQPVRTGVIALILGLVLGIGFAVLREFLDDSVKGKDDFERVASGVPVLGLIPVISAWRGKEDPYLVSIADPTSPAAEAYRTLRTSIQFLGLDQPMRTLQVTSPNPQEGKTTTLANLAVALARSGSTVAIVCCDLRRPRVHEFFGLENEVGFTSVLLGKVPLAGAMQEVPDQARLSLLASGPLPPNPSELLSSKRTVEVFGSLQAEYDIVLIDAPPVLPVTDALVLSGRVDATLLVAVAGATTRKEAARAVELLRQVDAPLVGAVLNGVDTEGSYGYAYQSYRYESPVGRREPAKK
ncbi:MAG TPA: polysaccharide biosynthesis tyrosine autokinase [Acidimicrobiales bacterium]|nr:polysaccharide biosynthesis tyrosine autokinase [Acidimicrobiales bacterium]